MAERLSLELNQWTADAVRLLPKLALAAFLLVAFWFLARFVRRLLGRFLDAFATPASRPLLDVVAAVGGGMVGAMGVFGALGVLALDEAALWLLTGAGIVLITAAVAFQDIAANFVAGVLLAVRQTIKPGDLIAVEAHQGKVHEVGLRSTTLLCGDGTSVVLPNRRVLGRPLVRLGAVGKRKVQVAAEVQRGAPLDQVQAVAIEALSALPGRDIARDVEVRFEDLVGPMCRFQVAFWIDFGALGEVEAARSDAVLALDRAFARAGLGGAQGGGTAPP